MADKSAPSSKTVPNKKQSKGKKQTEPKRNREDVTKPTPTKTDNPGKTKPAASRKKNFSEKGTDGKSNGPMPDNSSFRTKTTFVKQLVRETLREYDETTVESKDGVLENRNNRVFLGEFDFEEESECSEVLVESFGKTHTRQSALHRFRKMVKYVITAQRISKRTQNGTRKQSREDTMFLYLSLTDSSSQTEDKSDRPLFDLTPFKSIGEKNLSMSVKSVLEVMQTERTDHQVNTMMHMLRTFAKFSSYPYHIQRGICRQGWYARFESAKVICREGNRAEYYYLILSGVAVTHKTIEETSRGKTARVLRRGDTIGEREILTRADREATVISREPIEVLGIDGDELLNIFRSAGSLDHLDFLRGIPDIQLFPLELLQAYDFSCSSHYYRRGAVIVKDSNEAEWIYVVKTGSCQVYKAIKVANDVLDDRHDVNEMRMREEGGLVLPTLLPNVHPPGLSTRHSKGHQARHPAVQRVADMDRSLTLDNIQTKRKIHPLKKSTLSSNSLELPSIKPGQVSMVSSENEWVSESSVTKVTSENDGCKESSKSSKSYSAHSRRRKSAKRVQSGLESKKTVYYAKLDIVTEKECFGLQSLIYEDMPGLSLVSNGAECILISKQFFKENLTDNIVNHLKTLVSPYPNLGKLQDALSNQMWWGSYKQQVLRDSLQ